MGKEIKELRFKIEEGEIIITEVFYDNSESFKSRGIYSVCESYVWEHYKGRKIKATFSTGFPKDHKEGLLSIIC